MVLISSIKFEIEADIISTKYNWKKKCCNTDICETVWCQQILYHTSLSMSYLHKGRRCTSSELCNIHSHQGFYKWLQWLCVYLLHLNIFLPNPSPCHLVGLAYIVNRQLIGMYSVTIVPGNGCLIGIGIYVHC